MLETEIKTFIAQYDRQLWLVLGIVLVIGAARDWEWLCSPLGKPDGYWLGRTAYRVLYLLLGAILIGVNLYLLLTKK